MGLILGGLFAATPCLAQTSEAITPEEILAIRELGDVQLSPDGELVAFVVTEPRDPGKPQEPRRSNIWLGGTDGLRAPQAIAGASGGDSSPRWSRDGRLAFLSDRDGTMQVYVQRLPDAARRLTNASSSVERLAWSSDGSMIAFLARDRSAAADPIIVDAHEPLARLWVADVATGRATQVTHDDFEIADFAWSPTGDELAIVTSASTAPEDMMRLSLRVVSRAAGSVVRTLSSFVALAGALHWSPDGNLVTFFDAVPSDPYAFWLSVVPAQGGAVHPLLKDYKGSVLRAQWLPGGKRFMVQAVEGTREVLYVVDVDSGAMRKLTDVVTSQWDASFSTNGTTTAYLAQTPTSPSDVWVLRANGKPVRLTDFNPQTRAWRLGNVREVTWKNRRDGLTHRGVLITPPDYQPGRRYPTIVECHPGDTAWWTGWHGVHPERLRSEASCGRCPSGTICFKRLGRSECRKPCYWDGDCGLDERCDCAVPSKLNEPGIYACMRTNKAVAPRPIEHLRRSVFGGVSREWCRR